MFISPFSLIDFSGALWEMVSKHHLSLSRPTSALLMGDASLSARSSTVRRDERAANHQSEEQMNAASCVTETFINHRKRIISTVLVALMNSGRRGIQIQKTIRFSPRKRKEITKEQEGENKMPKDSYLPPSPVLTKTERESAEEQEASYFPAKKKMKKIPKTITKLRIIDGNIPRRGPPFFLSPFFVSA